MVDLDAVRSFWEANPLWSGESQHPAGSRAFFDEHHDVYVRDVFAGALDERLFPDAAHLRRVLDLGCGPGFWTVELARRGAKVVAADLTETALELARARCGEYGIAAEFRRENAECLSFADGEFSHVNCQGVIHHTPDTAAAASEIARVLEPGGTALISVYYRNVALRAWPWLRYPARLLAAVGGGLSGRGREAIFREQDVDEIVRLYDGATNPLGKSYDRAAFVALLEPLFLIDDVFLHYFPARSLPAPLPHFLHRWLDRHVGFLIYARLRKR